jgi:betaine-homocysteine S-methyltransferase
MGRDILKMLEEGVVLSDGGMIIEARWRGYETPGMILEDPDALRQIHQDFFRAGSHVLQAQTWWTSRSQLVRRYKPGERPSGLPAEQVSAQAGQEVRLEEISRTAIRLALEASGGEALVAGCLNQTAAGSWTGPYIFRPDNARARERACAEWDEHISWMVDAGAGLLVPETFARLDEARLCLSRCKKTDVPAMVLMGSSSRTQDGATPAECAKVLADEGADIVGLVCAGDSMTMWPGVLAMREAVDIPIAYQPQGYRHAGPNNSVIRESMIVSGSEMAEYALKAKAEGINFIGACCGAGPSHIRAMAQALGCERFPV